MEDIENKLKRIQETALDTVLNTLEKHKKGERIVTDTDMQMFDRSMKAFLTITELLDEI